jgi:hypothetical protein
VFTGCCLGVDEFSVSAILAFGHDVTIFCRNVGVLYQYYFHFLNSLA